MTAKLTQQIAAGQPSFGEIRFDRQRLFKSGERLGIALNFGVAVAASEPRFGEIGIDPRSTLESGQRFDGSVQGIERFALVAQGLRVMRIERDRLVEIRNRLVVSVEIVVYGSAIVRCFGSARV